MNRDEAMKVSRGDTVTVSPMHNAAEPKRRRHLAPEVKVEAAIYHANTATRVAFLVGTMKGSRIWVDASYFERLP
jgi:hypothetical protein